MSETARQAPPTLEELRARSREILQLAEAHGARNVAVFGSVARGRADGRSDVDFLVDMDPGRGLFDMGSLLMDLQDLLGCEVDVVTKKGCGSESAIVSSRRRSRSSGPPGASSREGRQGTGPPAVR